MKHELKRLGAMVSAVAVAFSLSMAASAASPAGAPPPITEDGAANGFYVVGDAGGLKDTGETTAEGQDGSVPEPGSDPGGNEDVPEGDVAVSDQEGTGSADGNSEYAIPSISQALPASVDAEAATGTDAGDEPVLSDQDVYLYCIDPEKLGTQIGEGALSFTPAENSLGSASLWHWMGTARVPLKPADEDYVAEGVKIAGNIDIYSTWLLESRMDQAVYKAYDSLFSDGDYPDVRVGGRTLVYDSNPDAVGDSYHVVWVRLVSATSSWVSDAGPGAAHGEGSVSAAAGRSYHLDGYIVDHSTRASVQYVMVPGVVPLNNLSSMPEGFVPDMDNTYQLNYSNLLPNRTSKLDMDTDVPYHDVRLESAVDPYAGEKVWFLDPECTQPFDFGSTPITQANLVLYAPLVTNVTELPKTGGDGTAACVVAGVALIAIAGVGAIWYAVRKKDGGGDPRGRDA